MMEVSVFGLGYVGCITAACFAQDGHQVIGVDVNPTKLEIIQQGQSPIVEEKIADIISAVVAEKRLTVSADPSYAVKHSEISLVAVGTPSNKNGDIDLQYLEKVCREIGAALAEKQQYHLVVIRSTVFPGTTENKLIPILEQASGKKCGQDFGVCTNPEFLREGSSVKDFYHPCYTLIGGENQQDIAKVSKLYHQVEAPVLTSPIKEAEMIKYVSNTFHALKVAFGNEIGAICKPLGIDSHHLMEIFCQDTKLNISPAYLKPGYAYGGSCLPKDLRCLQYQGQQLDLKLPLLNSISQSNEIHIQRGIDLVLQTGKKKVGVLGFSFKAGTDDLRESPLVILIETLLGKGLELYLYDKNVNTGKLLGANKKYIEEEIPHISSLMCPDLETVMEKAEVLVIGNHSPEFKKPLENKRPEQIVIDLVRITKEHIVDKNYDGIAW